MIINDLFEEQQSCPHCGGPMFSEMLMMEKKDACYYKVKASAKVWPSAYASGRLVQCRKKGAGNYGNKSEGVAEGSSLVDRVQQIIEKNHQDGVWTGQDLVEFIQDTYDGQIPDEEEFYDDIDALEYEDNFFNELVQVGAFKQGVAEGELDEGWKSALGAAALAGTMAMGAGGASARVMPGDDPGINRLTGKPIATQQATDTAPAKAEAPQGFSKEYLQKAANPDRFGRFLISVEKAQELLKQMNEGVAEEAPPGDKAERMVRHIKKSYAKDGKITDKEKGIAYATAWKAHNSGKLEEQNMSDEQATLQAKLQELEKQYDPSFEYSDDYRVWTQQKGIQNQINSIKQQLARLNETAPKEKEADYGDDYQDMVARVKKLAGLGPLKTVYDPAKRVYRNVPTAVQPKK